MSSEDQMAWISRSLPLTRQSVESRAFASSTCPQSDGCSWVNKGSRRRTESFCAHWEPALAASEPFKRRGIIRPVLRGWRTKVSHKWANKRKKVHISAKIQIEGYRQEDKRALVCLPCLTLLTLARTIALSTTPMQKENTKSKVEGSERHYRHSGKDIRAAHSSVPICRR